MARLRQIGEALSVFVVLITLAFLILEVRENTAAIRTESYGESINRLNDWRLELASNKELTKMFVDFNSREELELDPTEKQQMNFIIGSLWSIYESAYFAREYGTLGNSEWIRFEQMMCRQFITASAHAGYWDGVLVNQLSPEFKAFTEETCD